MLDLNYKPHVHCTTAKMSVSEWENARRNSLGGSDMATILGVSPYGNTKLDLYNTKLGIKPINGLTPTQEVIFNSGHFLENLVAQVFAFRTGYKAFEVKAMFEHPLFPFLRANIDRFYTREGQKDPISFLECKTSNTFKRQEWGMEEYTVPTQYMTQTALYMSVLNVNQCKIACIFLSETLRWVAGILYQMRFLFEKLTSKVLGDIKDQLDAIHDDSVQAFKPVFLSLLQGEMFVPTNYLADCSDAIGNDFVLRTLERDLKFEEYMIKEALKFWENHVLKKVPPSLSTEDPAAALATINKYVPPKKVQTPVILTSSENLGDLALELEELKAKKTGLNAKLKSLDRQIERKTVPFVEALGGANLGEFIGADGKTHTVSYEGKSRVSIPKASLERLKNSHPDVYSEYVKESTTAPTLKIN